MIRLFLIRHGNTFEEHQTPTQIGSKTDLSLTAQGKNQAEQIGLYLKSLSPSIIYHGPLKRHIETAQILASRLQIKHLPEPCLNEIDYGPWEGLTSQQIQKKWPEEYLAWTQQSKWPSLFPSPPPSPEVSLWLDQLRKNHADGETILCVSSNGLIRFFYAFQKKHWDHLAQTGQMDAIKVKTGHFCELRLLPHTIEIVSWNQNPTEL